MFNILLLVVFIGYRQQGAVENKVKQFCFGLFVFVYTAWAKGYSLSIFVHARDNDSHSSWTLHSQHIGLLYTARRKISSHKSIKQYVLLPTYYNL